MDINPIILSIPIYFLLIVIELLIQFFTHRKIYRLNDTITNISCGITQQVTGAFLKVGMIAAYQYVYEYWSITNIPVTWWSLLILVFAVDFCYYWAHRMSHEVNLFWGGHVVHHQSEDYNFSVALRQGSFQVLWTFWFYIPLAFLGFDTLTFLLVSALNTVYQFWIHTETIGKLPRPIEFIFNTPSHHRVHHGRDPKYIDKNHAGSLIIWDRMFGTFQQEEERPTYGITSPTNTWNPVWANLKHYVEMGDQLMHTEGLKNKMGILFNKPGWKPDVLGSYQGAPVVDKHTYHKFNRHPALQLALYVLGQFILVLGLTSVFLFQLETLSMASKFGFSVFIIWSVAQLGAFLEDNRKWQLLEYPRICMIGVLAYLMGASDPLIILAGAFVVGSLLWFSLVVKKSFSKRIISN